MATFDREQLNWLQRPQTSLEDLIDRYPGIWPETQEEVCEVLTSCDAERINAYALNTKKQAQKIHHHLRQLRYEPSHLQRAEKALVANRMVHLSLLQYYQALLAKHGGGKSRPWDKPLAKLVLNRQRRVPINDGVAGRLWGWVSNPGPLLGKAYQSGTYCVYTKEFIKLLAQELGQQPVLELAAGDGRLAAFLNQAGCKVLATDSYSWHHAIKFGDNVEKLSAKKALQTYRTPVVISCWPPAPNDFEKLVFNAPWVERYLVIGSRTRFATGCFHSYTEASDFVWTAHVALSRLVFPPQVSGLVYDFKRKP